MRVSYKEICRGEGKTYIAVSLVDVDGSCLEVKSYTGLGQELPCALYQMDSSVLAGNAKNYVLVLFSSSKKQTVVFTARSKDGKIVCRQKKTFRALAVKWISRFNGVFRKEECSIIRNYDWKGLNRQSRLIVNQYINRGDSFLLRGAVFTSFISEDSLVIKVFDAAGNMLNPKITFLSNAAISMNDGLNSILRELRFSLEVLHESNRGNYCIYIENKNEENSACFEVLEPHFIASLQNRYEEILVNANLDPQYDRWMRSHGITEVSAKIQRAIHFDLEPLFSIIVPLYKTPLRFLEEMVESVLAQTYRNWELILVNASPEISDLALKVSEYVRLDGRIRVVEIPENLGITENTREGIKASYGDFISFFDHDDVIEPNILFEYVSALNRYSDIDLLYCDEDKLYPDGSYGSPIFKPDFSIDLLRDNNYICHMLTVRKSLYDTLEIADKRLDGAQDHDLALKIAEKGRRIHHVSSILYHWRICETSTAGNSSSKPYATQAGILAVSQHLARLGIDARVTCAHGRDFRYKVDYLFEGVLPVSVIVPVQSSSGARRIINQLEKCFQESPFEVILSVQESNVADVECVFEEMKRSTNNVSVVSYAGQFNYSRAINVAVCSSTAEYLLFIHDDVILNDEFCLTTLLGHAARRDVGAIGPMICDLDGTIQQAGLGFSNGEIIPLFEGIHKTLPGYIFRPLSTQNLSAVSGVCMMTKRSLFDLLGGFDEGFDRIYGDVDYCFRLNKQSYSIVYTPEVVVGHCTSMSRGRLSEWYSRTDYYREVSLLRNRWADLFASGDPYLNRNFAKTPKEASAFKLDSAARIVL